MKRSIALLGVGSIVVAGLALTSVVRAGGQDTDETADKKIEKRIEIVSPGGGSFLGVDLDEVDGSGRGALVGAGIVDAERQVEGRAVVAPVDPEPSTL